MRLVRRFTLALVLATTAASLSAPGPARADFSAGGRKKKPGGGAKPAGGGAKPAGGGRPAGGGGRPAGARGDDGASKGPGAEVLIARYSGIVLAQPSATVPLQRLAQLYRERDGNLKKLIEEFEKRAGDAQAADRWNARVALAGIYRQDGRLDEAARAYEAAIADKPRSAEARLAFAQLQIERGDKTSARKQYDEALGVITQPIDRESTLRALRTLALDAKDFDGARGYQAQLVKAGAGSLQLRAELGRELLTRGEYARAEEEFRDGVKAASGDNRALAPALLDLGRAEAQQKKNTEALATLKRALGVAGSEAGVRSEILGVIAEVYRADNNLGALVQMLEKDNVQDFQRLVMLGSLYEETGAVGKAIATYRKALGKNGKNIETRVKIVRLLQGQGELDQAIAENEKLIQSAPRNAEFVFQLCETLLQRGDRTRALDLLSKLERSANNDEDVLTRVADFYERIEEKDRAMKIFARLTSVAPGDPAHLVELGDRYWQAGDKKKATDTWARIRTAVPNKAKALSALGEVLLDHDMVPEALAALKEAIDAEPGNVRSRKVYAMALERAATGSGSAQVRTARFDEARAAWEDILEKSGPDRLLAREARTHLVTLWGLLKQLEQRAEPLQRRLSDDPPDLEAGRLLAEVLIRLRKLPEAEVVLLRVTDKAPGDEEGFLALERVRMLQHNLAGAIEALDKLASINPKRAREYYQRMAQYSAELYKDDDAIRYAERAVALSPQDADGHKKLGEMYRRRGDTDKAIQAFRQAILMNDRLFPVYMELSELLVANGDADEADRLYRRVLRTTPDEELISQAGRLSMQRNLVKGSLAELENELLPLTLGHPGKRVYRRLLVEVYGHMTFPLMQRLRFGTAAEADEARAQLVKIGARGVKPLLDALADEQKSQVNTAIEVLAYVGNRGAAPALAAFALGPAEQPLRVRAMVATGALRDPGLLPRYEELVAPRDMDGLSPGDPVTVAAAWSVARMGDKKAVPLLEKMLAAGAPEVRAFGAIGLGLAHEKKAAARLEALAKATDGASPLARAAAALALGELGAQGSSPTLLALGTGADPFVRMAALAALVRLADPAVPTLALPALFSDDPGERRAAATALAAVVARDTQRRGEALPVATAAINVRAALEGLLPSGLSPQAHARALVAMEGEISKAAAAAAAASPDQAMRVADALLARSDGGPAFAPFTDGLETLPADEQKAAEKSADAVRRAVLPAFAALVRHPEAAVKTRAIRVLEGRSEDVAARALTEALSDTDPNVLRAALAAVQRSPSVRAARAVTRLLETSPAWSLRVVSAEALGPLARRESDAEAESAWKALAAAAKNDGFAVVREAAVRSLVLARAPNRAEVLAYVAAKDIEPELRALAAALSAGPAP